VMGKPWWSTGGYLIMLNAHKRNLAMTGQKKYMSSSQQDLPHVHIADLKVYNRVLREWCTVEAALGKRTPRSVSEVIKKLTTLQRTANYGNDIVSIIKTNAVKSARDIARLQLKDKQLKNYCMEILLGVDHNIYITQNEPGDTQKKTTAAMLKIDSQSYHFVIDRMLLRPGVTPNPLPNLVSQGTLTICDKKGKRVKGFKVIQLDNNKLKQELPMPKIAGVDKLYAHFRYKCAGVKISYIRELVVKEKEQLRKVWIAGVLDNHIQGWKINIRLANQLIYNGSGF
ncbi:MAG: hypothetical protein HRT88_23735, partial [Lentisphaeraceae bacterium]|nr:hypothetical protein [Lentisphaeraceae bacterium]